MPRYLFPALIDEAAADASPAGPAQRSTPAGTAPDITASDTEQFLTPIEISFPHILEKIQALWGYPEMDYYFVRLTIDDRGDRQGFPAEVWDDLQMLTRLHRDLFSDE